jgi:hypothetical protein
VLSKRFADLVWRRSRNWYTTDDHEIETRSKLPSVSPEPLPNLPLESIPDDSVSDAAADRDSQPRGGFRPVILANASRSDEHDKEAIARSPSNCAQPSEISSPAQPVARRKLLARRPRAATSTKS